MRRVHLRGRDNILKRLLVHGAAFHLSLILRKALGVGKPRQLQGLCGALFDLCVRILAGLRLVLETMDGINNDSIHFAPQSSTLGNHFFPGRSQPRCLVEC
jgi:hypothetical protein